MNGNHYMPRILEAALLLLTVAAVIVAVAAARDAGDMQSVVQTIGATIGGAR